MKIEVRTPDVTDAAQRITNAASTIAARGMGSELALALYLVALGLFAVAAAINFLGRDK